MPPTDSTAAMRAAHADTAAHAAPIRHSPGHDTLSLPARAKGSSQPGVSLPLYYREGFFTGDTLLHPELDGGRYGVAGDPVPETMRADDTVTIALLACFAITITATSRSLKFIARQAKELLRPTGEGRADDTETSAEGGLHPPPPTPAVPLPPPPPLAHNTNFIATTFTLASPYQLMGIFLGTFAAYFAAKALLYTAVNLTFFSRRANRQWLKSQLFITSAEGVMLFPVVLLMVYFDMPARSVAYSVAFVLIIVKILTFHKCHAIFFRHTNSFLQIILYFCALEIVPLAALWGALVETGNHLKINI